MTRLAHHLLLVVLAAVGVALWGCSPTPSPPPVVKVHDHEGHPHKHPETYAEAVTMIEEMHAEAKEHFAANDLKKADEPVHEVGHILEDVDGLADKASLADDAKAEIKAAVKDLFDCFDQLDQKIHSGKGATYEEVSEKLNAALATLRKHVPTEAAPVEKAPQESKP